MSRGGGDGSENWSIAAVLIVLIICLTVLCAMSIFH